MRATRVLRAVRIALLAGTAACATPASAHPHVMVSARAAIMFDEAGKVTGIRHAWVFDEAYSAFATTGFKRDANGVIAREALEELATLNVESLEDFKYFTNLKQGRESLEFDKPAKGYFLEHDGKALKLHFVLPLKKPAAPGKALTLRVDDETFFVSFTYAEGQAVTIEGDRPNCQVEMKKPAKSLESGSIGTLSEDFFNNMKSGFTADYAGSARLVCH